MATGGRKEAAAGLVGTALVVLFLLPPGYFVAGTFVVTSIMAAAAYWVGGRVRVPSLSAWQVVLGLVSAALLYAVFYAGNAAIRQLQLPGLGIPDAGSIYSLISSPANPIVVQLALLTFDAVGYESFFRGVLQKGLQGRMGPFAALAIALFDAGLHLATLNPLWVATTFVADLAWGLTYYYGKGLPASLTSHLVWDVAIFVIRPIT